MGQKIVMVNGSPRAKGGTSAAFEAIRGELERGHAEVHEYHLNQLSFRGCQGCMGCKRQEGCVLSDELTPVLDELKIADGLVMGSPIYMFAISGQTSLFLNRLYSLIDGNYRPRAGKWRKLMTVYSMGTPSEGYASAEENRVREAMKMLGFIETERVELTGIIPGQRVERLRGGAIVGKARSWLFSES